MSAPAARRVAAMMFGFTFLVYFLTGSGHLQTGDYRAELAVAVAIVDGQGFAVSGSAPYVTGVDGRAYAAHGIGQSLMLLPAALAGRLSDHNRAATEFAATLVNPVIVALTVAVLFLFLIHVGATGTLAAGLAGLFAFATIAWPYAHNSFDIAATGLSVLLGVYFAYRYSVARSTPDAFWCGAALGAAMLVRLPTAVVVPVVGLYVAVFAFRGGLREGTITLAVWMLPVTLALGVTGWYDAVRFGSPFETGYGLESGNEFSTPVLTGLWGQLASPGKSVFLFSPPLLLGILGFPQLARRHLALTVLLVGVIGVNLVLYSAFGDWSGDWAWGPRYAVPVTALMLLPAAAWLARGGVMRAAVAGVLGLAGLSVQILGVSIEFLHQQLLQVEDGAPVLTFWTPEYSAIWRHAVAFGGVLMGSARYPARFAGTWDLGEGRPLATTWDFWWNYALKNEGGRTLTLIALPPLLLAAGWMAWKTCAGVSALNLAPRHT